MLNSRHHCRVIWSILQLVNFDCDFTGPGAEKRSVRELAASLSKHGGPESENKQRKGGSYSESGWKLTAFIDAVCIFLFYICFMSLAMCFLQVFTGNNKFSTQSFILQRFALLFIVQGKRWLAWIWAYWSGIMTEAVLLFFSVPSCKFGIVH